MPPPSHPGRDSRARARDRRDDRLRVGEARDRRHVRKDLEDHRVGPGDHGDDVHAHADGLEADVGRDLGAELRELGLREPYPRAPKSISRGGVPAISD